jgi:TonB family protein
MARHRSALRPVGVALFLILVWPAVVWAQDSVQAAETLYAAAAYDEALAVLDRLQSASVSPPEVRQIEENRALCLLALGRTDAATQAIEAVVQADPLYRPDETTASPRIRSAYREVRSRLLPAIIQARYREARTLYEQQRWREAAPVFHEVATLAGDPALDEAQAKSLNDYRRLATDFAALSDAAQQAPPAAEPVVETAGLDAVPQLPPFDYSRIFGPADPDVVPPVTRRQDLPAWHEDGRPRPRDGRLEVVISASGVVERATLVQSMSPLFDRSVLESTRNWRYDPAQLDGRPVRYRKVIQIAF